MSKLSRVIKNEFIYSDEYNYDEFHAQKDFLAEQDAEEYGIPFEDALDEIDHNRVWEQIWLNKEHEWEDAKQRIKDLLNDRAFIAIGNVGTWQGDRGAGEVWTDSFDKFLYRILKDAYNTTIEIENGVLQIKAIHHDGTDLWSIKPLKERGRDAFWGWYNRDDAYARFIGLSDREMHAKLFDKPYYSAKFKEIA